MKFISKGKDLKSAKYMEGEYKKHSISISVKKKRDKKTNDIRSV